MNWQDEIRHGMELIIHGCKQNKEWSNCGGCPFNILCSSIYIDDFHSFSFPDSWEEEGIWD